MLYAREFIFSSLMPWVIHIRTDASPQFGRNYQVTEVDRVIPGSTVASTQITRRLMPLQCIGNRSADDPHIIQKVLHCLSLEFPQANYAQQYGYPQFVCKYGVQFRLVVFFGGPFSNCSFELIFLWWQIALSLSVCFTTCCA
jgi:hypothetical protein